MNSPEAIPAESMTWSRFSPRCRPSFFFFPCSAILVSSALVIFAVWSTLFTRTRGPVPNPLPKMVRVLLPPLKEPESMVGARSPLRVSLKRGP